MRKVTLKVTTRLLVPLTVTYTITANADEGVPMERLAKQAIKGTAGTGFNVEDSSFEIASVEGVDATPFDQYPLEEQISDYIEGDETANPKYIDHKVVDSR